MCSPLSVRRFADARDDVTQRDLNKLYKRCLDHVANKEKSLVLGALVSRPPRR
jgi:hypothetical protein